MIVWSVICIVYCVDVVVVLPTCASSANLVAATVFNATVIMLCVDGREERKDCGEERDADDARSQKGRA